MTEPTEPIQHLMIPSVMMWTCTRCGINHHVTIDRAPGAYLWSHTTKIDYYCTCSHKRVWWASTGRGVPG